MEKWYQRARNKQKRCNNGDLVLHWHLLSPLWVKSFPCPPWPALLLSCGSLPLSMHRLQFSSPLHLPSLNATPRKIPQTSQPGVCSGAGGTEIAPADTPPPPINKRVLAIDRTGAQLLCLFYETLTVPCLCFSKSAQNEMACFRANDTIVLNGMICLFVSSQEGRRREGMYIWSDPNHFLFVFCCFC